MAVIANVLVVIASVAKQSLRMMKGNWKAKV
jgi:hypothetical protein